MADFLRALAWTLGHEGGWSDDEADKGGATNYGITIATARRHGIGSVEDLKAITADKVAQIYRADYWNYDGIRNDRVAAKLFDMGVNMGPSRAIKYCQTALNDAGASLTVDGVYGPKTEAAVNASDPDELIADLCFEQRAHYLSICDRDNTQRKFLKGWLRRASEVPYETSPDTGGGR